MFTRLLCVLACVGLAMLLLGCGTLFAGDSVTVNTAAEMFERGNSAYRKGNLDQAIADYTKAIELDPQYAKAYYNRGNAYSAKGNLDQAIADYTQVIGLEPQSVTAYYNRGLVYSRQGHLDRRGSPRRRGIRDDLRRVHAPHRTDPARR